MVGAGFRWLKRCGCFCAKETPVHLPNGWVTPIALSLYTGWDLDFCAMRHLQVKILFGGVFV
jgi:hypothetical protein